MPTVTPPVRCNSQSVVTGTNSVHFEMSETLTNTAGLIRRCGRVRIELVLLLATLVDLKTPAVLERVKEYHLTEVVLVGVREER